MSRITVSIHGKRSIKAKRTDSEVLAHVCANLQSEAFIKSVTASARKSARLTDDDAEGETLRSELKRLDAKISRLSDVLSETTAAETLINKIEEFANQRDTLNN
ncbi:MULTISPECIES: hypothetical protein [unclassified Nitrosospira]|uniref:hypothetical protein n=1 Tax=unclassified Nitrosospira TaxID=2609267 RepID=UPI000D31BD35|nr:MULTISPECIES: hypothetical protein [unclassified Nitrosospira]PTR17632.1 hypothetical protein C8R31_101799 [Nitrosospira sp. Nsp2]WON74062.1 hypothetical protein R5L00_00795 [Nitrosospira sp. Is2]